MMKDNYTEGSVMRDMDINGMSDANMDMDNIDMADMHHNHKNSNPYGSEFD